MKSMLLIAYKYVKEIWIIRYLMREDFLRNGPWKSVTELRDLKMSNGYIGVNKWNRLK